MSEYPKCKHGHNDPNSTCPQCAAECAYEDLKRDFQQLQGEHACLNNDYAALKTQLDSVRELLRERVFWTAGDNVYDRQGYSAIISEDTAIRDINYRNRPLHATADEAIDAVLSLASVEPSEPKDSWMPIESAPKEEGIPFLVLCPKNDVADFVVVQVSKFQGDMYPDFLNANIDYSDRVTNALGWQPLPTPPTLVKEDGDDQVELPAPDQKS